MTSLSHYFKGSASKYLSSVDATPKSNQHEIGSNKFTAILGHPGSEKLRFRATFLFFNPDLEEPEFASDEVTYYDTRLLQAGRSPEYRLYYRTNLVTEQFREGDFCLIAAQTDGHLLIAIARPQSDHERRLKYLFDIADSREWVIGEHINQNDLDLASRAIVEALGIEIVDPPDPVLESLVESFQLQFPTTKTFSALARDKLSPHVSPLDNPDGALEEWMKQEERLFRALERAIVQIKIHQGFHTVDDFVAFSLSVQNRRKSRVGHALENHLEAVFLANRIPHARGSKTEGNSKPDFLFPGSSEYNDPMVSSPPLQMLAAKSTCKDRWRQILAEAARISKKHLFTLETSISESQTSEMIRHNVQLIVPPSVAKTYTLNQRNTLISLHDFLVLLRSANQTLRR